MKPGDKDGHGRYGYLDGDDTHIICHECGGLYRALAPHLIKAHDMTAAEYKEAHGLPRGMGLVAPETRRAKSRQALSHVGTPEWERMVEKRDPTAASHARTSESFVPRGVVVEQKTATARANIKGAKKPVTRRCIVCDKLLTEVRGRATCSDRCYHIQLYERTAKPGARAWMQRRDAGESLSEIGRSAGVSHVAVRVRIERFRAYLSLCAELGRTPIE
ncbi:MucR family transcriptional regulator [Corynebacterium striatum]|uniref:MucR family transcriptional regulator n=1 Tax=Corynebacterium striatum TaxID=43770 RepID=UPI0025501B9E|nr:MucR family transcriptional regulator [Corynebacterium striatum]MDK8844649.1 MucR family transcriptional regulator [Corynebacterium striatum]